MGGGGRGRVPGLAAYMRRPSPPSTFQNGSQGDFPTRGRAEPLKRNRIRLQPQLGPLEGETQVNNSRVRIRRTPRWQRGLCDPGIFPVPGHLAPSAHSSLLARAPSRGTLLLPDPAKWECPAGKVSAARSGRGRHAAASAVPCALPRLQGGAPHTVPRLHPARRQVAPARRAYLGGRHASAGVRAATGPALRLVCTGDPGDSLPVPAEVGAAIRPGGLRSRPASPRPPGAGHAGAASPLAGPGQGLPGPRDLKASAL